MSKKTYSPLDLSTEEKLDVLSEVRHYLEQDCYDFQVCCRNFHMAAGVFHATTSVPATLVLSLLRSFVEKDKTQQDKLMEDLAILFDTNDHLELGSYVRSLAGTVPTWVPM